MSSDSECELPTDIPPMPVAVGDSSRVLRSQSKTSSTRATASTSHPSTKPTTPPVSPSTATTTGCCGGASAFANSSSKKPDGGCLDDSYDAQDECAVCLQRAVYPVMLPCQHVFCFLCVKGLGREFGRSIQWHADSACPLCRKPIPRDYVINPDLVNKKEQTGNEAGGASGAVDTQAKWYYNGRQGGWWQYDERTAGELEQAVQRDVKSVDILIAGHVYVIDLEAMTQHRKDQPARRRKIKREGVDDGEVKGVAGIMKQKINLM